MSKHINLYHGDEQWLIKLNECRIKSDLSLKQIAERENIAERSVYRIFSGEAKNPSVDIVRRIIRAVGSTVSEIFEESGAVIGGQDVVTLQNKLDSLTADLSLLQAENAVLKGKADSLAAENELLRMKLEHKDEIISLHNYYNSLKGKEPLS